MNRHRHQVLMGALLLALSLGCDSPSSDNNGDVLRFAADTGPNDAEASRDAALSDQGAMVPDAAIERDGAEADAGQPTPSALNSAVDQVVEDFLANYNQLEGAAVIVLHRDRGVLHRKAYGSFDEDRVYFVASSSKMASAGIINALHDDGTFDMYQPIAEIVEWGASQPRIAPVHLISNSSGLPGLYSTSASRGHVCQFIPSRELETCAQAIFEAPAAAGDTIVEPDTDFRYGGGQWQVAGGVAEAASGKTWAQLFEEIYVMPCGLTSTGFSHQLQFGAGENYPSAFGSDINNLRPTDNPFIEGGMYTTIDDYGKLLMMHLNDGLCGMNRVHPAETIRRMHADRIMEAYMGTTGFPGLDGYGMGWWVDRSRESFTTDPGAYGAWPYIDWTRNIAVFSVIESKITPDGFALHNGLRAVIETEVDALATE